jgi:hypothetical protein
LGRDKVAMRVHQLDANDQRFNTGDDEVARHGGCREYRAVCDLP